MARIFNLSDYNDSRRRQAIVDEYEDTVSFENKKGDLIVVKPKEIKEVIKEYFNEELELYTDESIINSKFQVVTNVSKKMEEFERKMEQHINDKIDSLTERIMEAILSRVIEDEVTKRVDKKLKQIKDAL
jgi:hypothetical protein